MTWYVCVDGYSISLNECDGADQAPIIVKEGVDGAPEYAFSVKVREAEIVYQKGEYLLPDCRAHVACVTEMRPEYKAEPPGERIWGKK